LPVRFTPTNSNNINFAVTSQAKQPSLCGNSRSWFAIQTCPSVTVNTNKHNIDTENNSDMQQGAEQYMVVVYS